MCSLRRNIFPVFFLKALEQRVGSYQESESRSSRVCLLRCFLKCSLFPLNFSLPHLMSWILNVECEPSLIRWARNHMRGRQRHLSLKEKENYDCLCHISRKRNLFCLSYCIYVDVPALFLCFSNLSSTPTNNHLLDIRKIESSFGSPLLYF